MKLSINRYLPLCIALSSAYLGAMHQPLIMDKILNYVTKEPNAIALVGWLQDLNVRTAPTTRIWQALLQNSKEEVKECKLTPDSNYLWLTHTQGRIEYVSDGLGCLAGGLYASRGGHNEYKESQYYRLIDLKTAKTLRSTILTTFQRPMGVNQDGLTTFRNTPRAKEITFSQWPLAKDSVEKRIPTKGNINYNKPLAINQQATACACLLQDASINVYEIDTKKLKFRVTIEKPVETFSFSGDGNTLIITAADKTIYLFQISTGALLRMLENQEILQISHNSTLLITQDLANFKINIWDTAAGEPIITFSAPTELICSAKLFANNSKLVACSTTKAYAWDINESKLVNTYQFLYEHPLLKIVFIKPDNSHVVFYAPDLKGVIIWKLTAKAPLVYAIRCPGQDLVPLCQEGNDRIRCIQISPPDRLPPVHHWSFVDLCPTIEARLRSLSINQLALLVSIFKDHQATGKCLLYNQPASITIYQSLPAEIKNLIDSFVQLKAPSGCSLM